MDITQIADALISATKKEKYGRKNGKDKSGKRAPDIRFNINTDIQAAVWEAYQMNGELALYYQVSRMKEGERLLSLRAEDLIPNALALGELAAKFAKSPAVDLSVQRELSLFAQGLKQLVTPANTSVTARDDAEDPFADVRVDS